MSLLDKIIGTRSEREIKRIEPVMKKVLSYEDEMKALSDKELQHKTDEFKDRLRKGATFEEILPEAYAVAREACTRVLGITPYPVQIEGAILLHQGRIAELATGQGKTVTAVLPVYLNALSGKGVHVITVNDYLAERDSIQMGKVYSFLGLTTGLIIHEKSIDERREAYACDVTYGTNNEIGFDYLKDNMVTEASDRVQRGFNFCIVDEVDSVLIDDSRTPLIISGMGDKSEDGYVIANELVRRLKPAVVKEVELGNKFDLAVASVTGGELEEQYAEYDYVVEKKSKAVSLTSKGMTKVEAYYGIENYTDPENNDIVYYVERALKAHGIFTRDIDYLVKDGEVLIVDESTGRIMPGRRYSDGIHQAIEAKEHVNIKKESKTMASITFQNFFRKYKKLSGMTGTALTEEKEFRDVYTIDTVAVPTHQPTIRLDLTDKVYLTRKEKLKAIVNKIKEVHATGQPLLVGTTSVEASEELSNLLKHEGIEHQVLNAKYHELEAMIVAQAGKENAVTISTNMAGRGTDILLGGNPEYLALQKLQEEGVSDELIAEANGHRETDNQEIIDVRNRFKELVSQYKDELAESGKRVRELGGLYVLGTERHESRRIDNQLRGRSGRQGDPGVSEFYISLEDNLMKLFASEKVMDLFSNMDVPPDTVIDLPMMTQGIERAQKNIESIHASQRSHTLEYDEVISEQREKVYSERNQIIDGEIDYIAQLKKMASNAIAAKVKEVIYTSRESNSQDTDISNALNQNDILALIKTFESVSDWFHIERYTKNDLAELADTSTYKVNINTLTDILVKQFNDGVDFIEKNISPNGYNLFFKRMMLANLDRGWQDHMVDLDRVKQGIGLQALGQRNPLDEFKHLGYDMFNSMMDSVQYETVMATARFATAARKREQQVHEAQNLENKE